MTKIRAIIRRLCMIIGYLLSMKIRVLYFTIVSLDTAGNGGGLCCRNHVARLAADPNIALFAMLTGPIAPTEATDAFFAGLKVPYHFQPFRESHARHGKNDLLSSAKSAAQEIFQIPWEMQSLYQEHVEDKIAWAVRAYSIDVVVIDYLPSALFVHLPRGDAKTVLINLNREGDFLRDRIRLGHSPHGKFAAAVSLSRTRRFERRTAAAVDQVVAIGPPDLPKHKVRRPPICITPYLDPKPERWRYTGSRRAFFVGGIGHYPNRLAIEWLTGKLAPALTALGSDVRLTIVGATEADIAATHQRENIELRGTSDASTVSALFRSSDIMICPIENDYGVKFKALEALAHGTPLFASRQTMLGLPHLRSLPTFDLRHPEQTAAALTDLMSHGDRLAGLAQRQQQQQRDFIASQRWVWSETLQALLH
jgi:glycosyltransferase involved in cell wall biosynthesis